MNSSYKQFNFAPETFLRKDLGQIRFLGQVFIITHYESEFEEISTKFENSRKLKLVQIIFFKKKTNILGFKNFEFNR